MRVGHRLALGRLADQDLAIVAVGDDRRGGTTAFGVLDDLGHAVLQNGHAGVGGAQVDTDDFAHFTLRKL
ncbi:NAD-specific glutamate dehydrogenase [compost metagenome]